MGDLGSIWFMLSFFVNYLCKRHKGYVQSLKVVGKYI
ncbi:MAG: hypothetical protein C5S45_03590 [Candidatus Methanocomedens sp.]|nr:MAG: hypothetical protein C5S45_03590 [ANME-2 cluster archaeon]